MVVAFLNAAGGGRGCRCRELVEEAALALERGGGPVVHVRAEVVAAAIAGAVQHLVKMLVAWIEAIGLGGERRTTSRFGCDGSVPPRFLGLSQRCGGFIGQHYRHRRRGTGRSGQAMTFLPEARVGEHLPRFDVVLAINSSGIPVGRRMSTALTYALASTARWCNASSSPHASALALDFAPASASSKSANILSCR